MYCTVDDIKGQLPNDQLIAYTSDDPQIREVNLDVVNLAIKAACGTIDAHVRNRFPVPLSEPVPDEIKGYAVDIAIFNLCGRKNMPMNDNRRARQKDAIRALEAIRDGKMDLSLGPVSSADFSSGVVVTSPFGRRDDECSL